MKLAIELSVLLVAVVFSWRRTAAWHIQQGRGKLAARVGALGAAITAFVIVAGLLFVFDPPPGLSGTTAQPAPAASVPPTNAEPAQGR
jgi:hypothetical protein